MSKKATLEHIEPLLVGAVGAAKLVGVGKSLFYEMASTGPKKLRDAGNAQRHYSCQKLSERRDSASRNYC